jgi:hypothetical protein
MIQVYAYCDNCKGSDSLINDLLNNFDHIIKNNANVKIVYCCELNQAYRKSIEEAFEKLLKSDGDFYQLYTYFNYQEITNCAYLNKFGDFQIDYENSKISIELVRYSGSKPGCIGEITSQQMIDWVQIGSIIWIGDWNQEKDEYDEVIFFKILEEVKAMLPNFELAKTYDNNTFIVENSNGFTKGAIK